MNRYDQNQLYNALEAQKEDEIDAMIQRFHLDENTNESTSMILNVLDTILSSSSGYSQDNGFSEAMALKKIDMMDRLWRLLGDIKKNDFVKCFHLFKRSCQENHIMVAQWLWKKYEKKNFGLIIEYIFNEGSKSFKHLFKTALNNNNLLLSKWLYEIAHEHNYSVVDVKKQIITDICDIDSIHLNTLRWLFSVYPSIDLSMDDLFGDDGEVLDVNESVYCFFYEMIVVLHKNQPSKEDKRKYYSIVNNYKDFNSIMIHMNINSDISSIIESYAYWKPEPLSDIERWLRTEYVAIKKDAWKDKKHGAELYCFLYERKVLQSPNEKLYALCKQELQSSS